MDRRPRLADRRARLAAARVMYLFTPPCGAEDAGADAVEAALARLLSWVDVLQVRVKPRPDARPDARTGKRTEARASLAWCERVLRLRASCDAERVLVLVNDRVDVARTLADTGCDGVHLGQDDTPPGVARELLGPELLIGLSTHDAGQVVLAGEEPVDYLGFGPVYATATKGYARGLGSECAWIAAESCALPVFAIGGIDAHNAGELERVGRAAVSSALDQAADPVRVAQTLRAALTAEE